MIYYIIYGIAGLVVIAIIVLVIVCIRKNKSEENKNADIVISERIIVLPDEEGETENNEITLDNQSDIQQAQIAIDNLIAENQHELQHPRTIQVQRPGEIIVDAYPVESPPFYMNDSSEDYTSSVHNRSVRSRNSRTSRTSRNSTYRSTEADEPPAMDMNDENDDTPLPSYTELLNGTSSEDTRPFITTNYVPDEKRRYFSQPI